MRLNNRRLTIAAAGILLIAACGKEEKNVAPSNPTSSAAEKQAEVPSGRVIVVEASSDEKGNYFTPSEIEAHRGDIVRFTLKAGVHNVHFLPDSNPGKAGLPAASEFLQLPGQTWDYKVTLGEGKYYFQCDPHAALGMKGHLKVED
jgi:plastocyanin